MDLTNHAIDSPPEKAFYEPKNYTPLAALAALALAAGSAQGALLVYEGFNHTPASATNDPGSAHGTGSSIILTGKGGTTEVGLSGTWANAANDAHNMYLVEGSLSFGDLQTSGITSVTEIILILTDTTVASPPASAAAGKFGSASLQTDCRTILAQVAKALRLPTGR